MKKMRNQSFVSPFLRVKKNKLPQIPAKVNMFNNVRSFKEYTPFKKTPMIKILLGEGTCVMQKIIKQPEQVE
ncbi:hypothetical protein [Bacillus sp. ISL-55]|uniref:hypothetical protein n=1 Tax=Bacillus sp. ISL-55 TaxID=2819134 RepID=UPI001BE615F2|nr:hypothetical protein [Bacillus sp. ISL-55]